MAATRPSLLLASLYVLTIVGFPLASTIPAILRLDSQLATIPYRVLVVGLSLAVIFGWWVRGTRVCFSAAVLASLTLWVMLLARLFYDTLAAPLPGELFMPVSQLLLLSIGGCFLPALAALEAPNERTLDLARRSIEVLGAIAMVAILYVGLRGVMQGSILYRLATPVLNPISVGHLGVSVMAVTLCGFATSGRIARLLRTLLVVLSVVVVVATVSRGPIAAALVVALLLAVRPRPSNRAGLGGVLARLGLIGIVLAILAAGVYYLEEAGIIDVVARLSDTLQDVASQDRALMLVGAWQQFTENPLLGSGFVERRFMENPHNIIAESMMATGIIGLGLLLASISASVVAAFRILFGPGGQAWVGLIYVQYLIHCLLSGSLLTDGPFWFFGLAVLALVWAPRAAVAR